MFDHFKALLLQGFFMCVSISALAVDFESHPANTLWFSLSSDNYSESFSIGDLYNDNPQFAKQGEIIYSFSQWQYGYQINDYIALGFIRGLDIYAKHSSSAADIYYLTNTKDEKIEDGDYLFTLNADVQRTQGLFVALNTQVCNLSVTALLEGGQVFGLTAVDVNGNVRYQEEQLAGTLDIDYYYESDALYGRKLTSTPEGRYWSLSLKFEYASRYGQHLLMVKDAVNETYWSNAPRTQATLNTDRIVNIDNDGIITVRPLGSGRESFTHKTQIFPARIEFKNYLDVSQNVALIVGLKAIDENTWPFIGTRINHLDMNVSYHINEQSISIEHGLNSNFRYQLAVDKLSSQNAQRLQLGLEVSY